MKQFQHSINKLAKRTMKMLSKHIISCFFLGYYQLTKGMLLIYAPVKFLKKNSDK